jgi:hypothetical protein
VAFRWYLPLIAIVAIGLAIWAGPNLATAVPAAAVGLIAASLLFLDAWSTAGRPIVPALGRRSPETVDGIRSAFRSGVMGREKLIDLLDRLDRAGPTPYLPARRTEEIRALVRLSPSEFRDYLRQRLDALEAHS